MTDRKPIAHLAPVLLVVFTCLAVAARTEARTIYVSPTGDGTTGDSWQTAFHTLNAAYGASGEGDHIYVESGVYKETLLVTKNSIELIGGLAGNKEPERSDTRVHESDRSILDANGAFSIVVNFFQDGSVDGFVLRNSTSRGSAVSSSSVGFRNCDILNNTNGGGVYIESSTVEFHNCTIANNQCDREAGGIGAYFGSSVLIDSCTIEDNEGVYCGGLRAAKMQIIRDSIIRANKTTGEGIMGGGIQIHDGTVEITNSLIYENTTVYAPGAQVSLRIGGLCQILSSTILGSQDEVFTDIQGENPFIIDNSILWGAPGILKAGAQVLNSCVQGGYTGLGNISDDPRFRDSIKGDFRLLPESPCIDTAGTSGPSEDLNGKPRPVDIAGMGREVTDTYDMGAYEFQLEDLPHPSNVADWTLYGVRE